MNWNRAGWWWYTLLILALGDSGRQIWVLPQQKLIFLHFRNCCHNTLHSNSTPTDESITMPTPSSLEQVTSRSSLNDCLNVCLMVNSNEVELCAPGQGILSTTETGTVVSTQKVEEAGGSISLCSRDETAWATWPFDSNKEKKKSQHSVGRHFWGPIGKETIGQKQNLNWYLDILNSNERYQIAQI